MAGEGPGNVRAWTSRRTGWQLLVLLIDQDSQRQRWRFLQRHEPGNKGQSGPAQTQRLPKDQAARCPRRTCTATSEAYTCTCHAALCTNAARAITLTSHHTLTVTRSLALPGHASRCQGLQGRKHPKFAARRVAAPHLDLLTLNTPTLLNTMR